MTFLILSCYSCNNRSDYLRNISDLHIVDFDKGEKKDTLFLSSLFRSVKCIQLEVTENSLLSRISKILVYKNQIFLFDNNRVKGLYVFDTNGRFIRKIAKRGLGPGEYNNIQDFTINPDNEEIILIADYKILFFDIITGSHKATVPLQYLTDIYSVQYFEKMLYTDVIEHKKTSNDYLVQSIDLTTGKQLERFLNSNDHNKGVNDFIPREVPNFIPSLKPPFLFRPLFSDTFYTLTQQGVSPYLTVKSGDFVKKKDFDSFEKIYPDFVHGTDKIYMIYSYFNKDNYIYLKFRRMIEEGKIKEHSVIYNTKTKSTQIFNVTSNDLLYKRHGAGISFKSIFYDESGVFECINSFLLPPFLKIISNNEINDSIKDQIFGLNEQSNPVLFYYEFK